MYTYVVTSSSFLWSPCKPPTTWPTSVLHSCSACHPFGALSLLLYSAAGPTTTRIRIRLLWSQNNVCKKALQPCGCPSSYSYTLGMRSKNMTCVCCNKNQCTFMSPFYLCVSLVLRGECTDFHWIFIGHGHDTMLLSINHQSTTGRCHGDGYLAWIMNTLQYIILPSGHEEDYNSSAAVLGIQGMSRMRECCGFPSWSAINACWWAVLVW